MVTDEFQQLIGWCWMRGGVQVLWDPCHHPESGSGQELGFNGLDCIERWLAVGIVLFAYCKLQEGHFVCCACSVRMWKGPLAKLWVDGDVKLLSDTGKGQYMADKQWIENCGFCPAHRQPCTSLAAAESAVRIWKDKSQHTLFVNFNTFPSRSLLCHFFFRLCATTSEFQVSPKSEERCLPSAYPAIIKGDEMDMNRCLRSLCYPLHPQLRQ